ncbi:hypothetical protein T12_5317 [Trichinella patagoniensis]|uniref:Uncharacterized protein n=1 Tax=Trichinella patagoniensis TaxID=990121 RepID=A0A0V0ZDJ4_9BILA|nr:hypothetical protein T12_5317 [Trichinella patagoniensis]
MARSRRNSALCESEMENLSCNIVCEKNFTSIILPMNENNSLGSLAFTENSLRAKLFFELSSNCYPSYGHVTALLSSIFQIRQHHELNNTIFGRFVEREVSALGWAAW